MKRHCKNCNQETPKWGSSYKKYCNLNCQRQFEKMSARKPKKEKVCVICSESFVAKTSLNKYCSKKCGYIADNKRRSNKPQIKTCKCCAKVFKPYTSLDKYCSTQCRIDNQKNSRSRRWNKESCERIKGSGNPAYRNGMYSSSSTKTSVGNKHYMKIRYEIRAQKIESHGYLFCDHCGTTNTYQFEMHHIVFRSEKPRHKNLHHKDNLIDLCMICHNKFHKNKEMRNPLVKERDLNSLFECNVEVYPKMKTVCTTD